MVPPKVSMSKIRDGELMKDDQIIEYMLPNQCQTSTKTDIFTFTDTINHPPKINMTNDTPATDKLIKPSVFYRLQE